MADIRPLTEQVSVGGQIWLDDIEILKAQGVELLICNRPDGEIADQPSADSLKQACEAAGITFLHIPMTTLSQEPVESSVKAYAEHRGRTHAFCGSGTRSTVLWCFSHVKKQGVESVIETASAAGYHISHIAPALHGFAKAEPE